MIVVSILLVFHQLITANQTFIFSLIPILAGLFHIIMVRYISKFFLYQIMILLLVILVTIKYHTEYNVKRNLWI